MTYLHPERLVQERSMGSGYIDSGGGEICLLVQMSLVSLDTLISQR